MARFRKKPVVIEAFTFDEVVELGRQVTQQDRLIRGMPWHFMMHDKPLTHESDDCYLIPTLEGTMRFERGDMLIIGVQGELYPCRADIFEATYEPADNDSHPTAVAPLTADEEGQLRRHLRLLPQNAGEWAIVLQDADRLLATLDAVRARHAALLYQYNACHADKAALEAENARLAKIEAAARAWRDALDNPLSTTNERHDTRDALRATLEESR